VVSIEDTILEIFSYKYWEPRLTLNVKIETGNSAEKETITILLGPENFFLKMIPLRVMLCGELIARIPEA
jgi:hypothetical protein